MLDSARVSTVTVQWMTIVYLACALLVGIIPGPMNWIGQRSFHMMNAWVGLSSISFSGLVIGLVFMDVIAYLGALLFVWLWNRSGSQKA